MKDEMVEPQTRGDSAEKLVKENLWQRNYRVKDVSRTRALGCDLIVDNKHRVEVKSMMGDTTTLRLTPSKFDVLCLVVLVRIGPHLIFYIKDKDALAGLKKDGVYHITPEAIREHFTEKPSEVFKD